MMELIDKKRIRYTWMIDDDGQEHDGVTLQSVIDKLPVIDAVPRDGEEWKEHYENSYNQGFIDACKHYQTARDLAIEDIKRVAKEEETADMNWSKGLNYSLNIISKYF